MSRKKTDTSEPLGRQLRWLMFFRLVTTTFLLATTIVVQFRDVGGISDQALTALYGIIGIIYFLTFLYALLLPRLFNVTLQAFIQITGDLCVNSVIIYMTGGLESAFSFMYILSIINAGILLKVRGAIITASLSAIMYGALLDLHYYGYIEPYMTRFSFFYFYRAKDILNMILVNMGAFYLVAYLSGYLSKQAEESRIKLAQRQSALERLEELNESIIQSMDSGLITLSPEGEVLSLNPAAERITAVDFRDVEGRSYREAFAELNLPNPAETGEGPPATWNLEYKRGDGEKLFLDLTLLGLRSRSGETWGRLLVIQDRTRIRRMEEEVKRVERLAVIGELAAGIAHEIRNPLASISGSFQLLENPSMNEDGRGKLLTIIKRELDRLNRIVNDFLMFARPRAGEPAVFNLSRTIEDNLKIFEHQAGLGQKIILEKELEPNVTAYFPPHKLEQVMWNLLRNSVEAMPEGGRLRVSVERSDNQDLAARVVVTDTGQGISPDDLSRVFDPFFTTKEGGSGLGLAIVFRIMEEGGGRIDIQSSPESGTRAILFLPTDEKSGTGREGPDPEKA